tara:strand:+ start:384 stop:1469 length:1086 start_codon:yes stop_codon:yes gene_type:complete
MDNPIHIVLASDERYFPGLLGTLGSIVVNTKCKSPLCFYIIDGGISNKSWQKLSNLIVRFQNVKLARLQPDLKLFADLPDFFFESKLTYARLLLEDLIPVLDKVIYIDTDILFLKDIEELWKLSLEGKSALVALEKTYTYLENDCPNIDILGLNPKAPYFNAGLMVMDLERFRKYQISKRTLKYISEFPEACLHHDQSALNVTLYEDFKLIDQSWNTQAHRDIFKIEKHISDFANRNLNFHFVTKVKPWLTYSEELPYKMFVILLEELSIDLNKDEMFQRSKKEYFKRDKFRLLLPVYYKFRGAVNKTKGGMNASKTDDKLLEYWQEQNKVRNFHRKHLLLINEILDKWRKHVESQSTKLK